MNARAAAARVLADVLGRRQHLDLALARHLETGGDTRDNALVRELCYGVMRWYFRLDFVSRRILKKPLRKKDTDIRALILCGLYQQEFMRIPDHAAIAATVAAARELQKTWAAGLVNAVLRRYQREAPALRSSAAQSPAADYAHPDWLIEALRAQWPARWEDILTANNRHPPLHLRVNLRKTTRQAYQEMLQQQGIKTAASDLVPSGVHILEPMDAADIPGFQDGLVSVQDFGAQLAAPLLDVRTGQRVLDGCAAPGGKTGHIFETCPEPGELLAVDSGTSRVELLRNTRQRLGITAKLVHADIIHTDDWWDGNPFDRILLDVPCSATGVIRRHPDIKYLRDPDQIRELVNIQRQILESVWPALMPGGRLLYITCSVLRSEGSGQMEAFIRHRADAVEDPIVADWGVPDTVGRQLLPGDANDTDGFYYAALVKTG